MPTPKDVSFVHRDTEADREETAKQLPSDGSGEAALDVAAHLRNAERCKELGTLYP